MQTKITHNKLWCCVGFGGPSPRHGVCAPLSRPLPITLICLNVYKRYMCIASPAEEADGAPTAAHVRISGFGSQEKRGYINCSCCLGVIWAAQQSDVCIILTVQPH